MYVRLAGLLVYSVYSKGSRHQLIHTTSLCKSASPQYGAGVGDVVNITNPPDVKVGVAEIFAKTYEKRGYIVYDKPQKVGVGDDLHFRTYLTCRLVTFRDET